MTGWFGAAVAALLVAGAPIGASGAWAAGTLGEVEVELSPVQADVVLGETLDIEVTVRNLDAVTSPPLVVHIDITDPAQDSSVDPEDWTATLTKSVGTVGPGAAVVVPWTLQPISPGGFTAYAVAITADGSAVVVSDTLRIDVEDRRSLDPGGVLPVAIGGPVLIGVLLLHRVRAIGRRTVVVGTATM